MDSVTNQNPTKTAKGEQTRALILNTALDLLQEHGYEKTTMRAIAKKAGVSLGNAYHYFDTKEHLIQAFYHRTHEEHLAATVPALTQVLGHEEPSAGGLAPEDFDARALSRICRRALQDCRRSAQSTESFCA